MALQTLSARVKFLSGNKPNGAATTFTGTNGSADSGGFNNVEAAINPITGVAIATGDVVPYCAQIDNLYEEGYGVIDKTAHTLTRTQVLNNSSGTVAKIDFSAASANPTIELTWGSVLCQSAVYAIMGTQAGARVTGTANTPVTAADVTAITTIYLEPYKGGSLPMFFDTTGLLPYRLVIPANTISKALGTLASGVFPVDVYVDQTVLGTTAMTLVPWTSATARATSVARHTNGYLYKSGDLRYILAATVRPKTTTTTEDSDVWRGIVNHLQPIERLLYKTSTNSHSLSSATWIQWDSNAANQVDLCIADPDAAQIITYSVWHEFSGGTTSENPYIGAMWDATNSADIYVNYSLASTTGTLTISAARGVSSRKRPVLGNHFIAATEIILGGGSVTSGGFYLTAAVMA